MNSQHVLSGNLNNNSYWTSQCCKIGKSIVGAEGAQFYFQKSSHLQPLASGCLWLLVAASGCLGKWLQVVACGCLWLQMAASGCLCLLGQVVASGCKWLLVAASGCLWLLQVAAWGSGCKLLEVAASGSMWLQPSAATCSQLEPRAILKTKGHWVFFQDLNARDAKC